MCVCVCVCVCVFVYLCERLPACLCVDLMIFLYLLILISHLLLCMSKNNKFISLRNNNSLNKGKSQSHIFFLNFWSPVNEKYSAPEKNEGKNEKDKTEKIKLKSLKTLIVTSRQRGRNRFPCRLILD